MEGLNQNRPIKTEFAPTEETRAEKIAAAEQTVSSLFEKEMSTVTARLKKDPTFVNISDRS